MVGIFVETKIFGKSVWLLCRDTLWVKISSKSLSHIFRDISIFEFCNFCKIIRKFKMAAIFGETKIFGKSGWLFCRDNLCLKISSKLLYLARFSRYKFVIKNLKWPPFLVRQKFLEHWDGYSTEIPCGSKLS